MVKAPSVAGISGTGQPGEELSRGKAWRNDGFIMENAGFAMENGGFYHGKCWFLPWKTWRFNHGKPWFYRGKDDSYGALEHERIIF